MWPRLIAQLIELLPHVSRLVPLADNYLNSKASGDRSHALALSTLGDTVRGDIATVSGSCELLSKQIADQSARIAALQRTIDQADADRITQTRHIEWLTKDINSLRVWVKFGTAAILLMIAVTLGLTVKIFLAH